MAQRSCEAAPGETEDARVLEALPQDGGTIEIVGAEAAAMILDRELNGEVLAAMIRGLYENGARREAMGRAALRLAKPEAASRIVDECTALVGG